MLNTVTDMIGDEYKEWMTVNNVIVFITSPTGSGKTFFILHSLLPYLSEKNQKILYLVNRKILKEQIEEEIICFSPEYSNMICVELYQNIEIRLKNMEMEARYLPNYSYDCVVCDECHYFLADANYNTNTDLSLNYVFDMFAGKPKIFISATIDNIKSYIEAIEDNMKYSKTAIYHFPFLSVNKLIFCPSKLFYYPDKDDCQKRDYSYINVNIIEKDEIVDVVLSRNDKWLIFVDNIRFGKQIKQEIKNSLEINQSSDINKRVVMITSDYEQDEESFAEVDMITNNSKFSAEVIIATSVMDNGITIKDIELRNVLLIADTEIQFIQMLGRKRMDNKNLNLYIVRQTKGHFVIRKKNALRILKIALKYMKPFDEGIKIPLKEIKDLQSYAYNFYNHNEAMTCIQQHIWLMNELADHKIQWEDVCNLFRVCKGIFYLNLLSYRNIQLKCQYYYKIIKKFEMEGEDAFVKEQLKWLGKTDEEVEELIIESMLSKEEKCRKIVLERFKELFVDEEGIEKEAHKKTVDESKEWKNKIKKELLTIVENTEYGKGNIEEKNKFKDNKEAVIGNIKKNYITKPTMEFLRIYCGLPYTVTVKDKIWTISKYKDKMV